MDDMTGVYFQKKDRHNQYYIYADNNEWTSWGLIESKKPVFKTFYKYKPDFLYFKQYSDFLIKINPVFHFEIGKDLERDHLLYHNIRGIEIRGMISEKLGFYSFVSDNQIGLPLYEHSKVLREEAMPGEGKFEPYHSSIGNNLLASGIDFFKATGYISFNPIERINIQFGHDKNFIGNGIRSLFLSEYSANYMFLKINTRVWRFNYQNIFTELTSQFNYGPDQLLPKKICRLSSLEFKRDEMVKYGIV